MPTGTANEVYVVTGGNRGLGLGLVKTLLARPNHTVIATVRSDQADQSLREEIASASKGEGSTLHIVHLDFAKAIPAEDIRDAFIKLNIDHIDVLVLNAGGAQPMTFASQTTIEDLRISFEVNTIAPLLVFQGLWPLLEKSQSKPKLIWITSAVGSIGAMSGITPGGAYGPSRAAQNWLAKALHLENDHTDSPIYKKGLIAIALHPGWVQTRAGQFVADEWSLDSFEKPPTSVEESVNGMLTVIDGATEEDSGKFINAMAETNETRILPW